MTHKDYQSKSVRTLARQTTPIGDVSHMLFGIVSELNEVYNAYSDPVNMGEELGDIYYYLAGLCTLRNINFENVKPKNIYLKEDCGNRDEEFSLLSFRVSQLVDFYKAPFFYRQNFDEEGMEKEEELSLINGVVDSVSIFAALYDIDINEMMEKNYNKLMVRYKNKFTAEEAARHNRDLVEELKKLR